MLGTLLGGRYKVIATLGAGGFGQTFLVEDVQQPGRAPCVVKQFKPASTDTDFLEVARRLFDTEVKTLERLGQHDQIPQFFEAFEENREFYLVQEFIDGQPLNEEMSPANRFSEEEVIGLLQGVLHILEFVHENRVIHRDVKPGNLIRRRHDGKVVLIDFGAVKELQTQIMTGTGQTGFTVGIGTQGYTPGEQLAGKPRFSSDIYALGITAIQAMTGMQPSQFPEDPDTAEIVWQPFANVSLGLSLILDRMVRYQFSQRYQSAAEVLGALQRLLEEATNLTSGPRTWLDAEKHRRARLLRKRLWAGVQGVAIATVAIAGAVLGARQIGMLEPLELASFDQMVRLRPDAPPDPRLLIVAITEPDLQSLQRATPSDQDVAQVLANLQQHQPRVIGLDLHRDLPQAPGRDQLLSQLQQPNLVAIMKLGTTTADRVPPPAEVPDQQIGFSDLPIDPDGVVRRNLMFASSDTEAFYSFSLRTALQFLAAEDIQPQNDPTNPDLIQLGNFTATPLSPTSGGYQHGDTAGYQVLLNYRARRQMARQVTFSQVLNQDIDPAWVNDKVVLIGTTAPSAKDLFYTPYSAAARTEHQMPGVTLHAQMVSQILTMALEGQPLIWYWSDWLEGIWIVGWTVLGGAMAWGLRHPLSLGGGSLVLLVGLLGSGLMLFLNYGWVPIAAPAIALVLTIGAVAIYRAYWPSSSGPALPPLPRRPLQAAANLQANDLETNSLSTPHDFKDANH